MQPNVPTIPPAQSAFVLTIIGLILLAFVCMLILKVAIYLAEKRAGVTYQWEPPEPTAPSPFRAWAARQEQRYTPRRYVVLSSWGGDESESISDPVYIPVSNTSTPEPGMDTATPDMDAEKNEMPRLSRDITPTDELALLCVIRNPDGKHRHSANDIYKFVGGDRNKVMATIREIRGTPAPAEFRQPDGSTAPASRPVTT
jgi:hypothetical protein